MTNEEKEMKESIDETLSKEHSLSVQKKKNMMNYPTVGIAGMEDLPASMIALPYVKLVQKSSSKTILTDGKDATPGTYYFTDTQEAVKELNFVILRSKVVTREFVQNEEVRKVTQLISLCIAGDLKKLFILVLPITSFTSWGKLIAKMKNLGIKSAWENIVVAKSEKRENAKGQFFVADLQLGEKLNKERENEMAEKYGEYGGVLERRDVMDESENQQNA